MQHTNFYFIFLYVGYNSRICFHDQLMGHGQQIEKCHPTVPNRQVKSSQWNIEWEWEKEGRILLTDEFQVVFKECRIRSLAVTHLNGQREKNSLDWWPRKYLRYLSWPLNDKGKIAWHPLERWENWGKRE